MEYFCIALDSLESIAVIVGCIFTIKTYYSNNNK